jgi:hypothetical protein
MKKWLYITFCMLGCHPVRHRVSKEHLISIEFIEHPDLFNQERLHIHATYHFQKCLGDKEKNTVFLKNFYEHLNSEKNRSNKNLFDFFSTLKKSFNHVKKISIYQFDIKCDVKKNNMFLQEAIFEKLKASAVLKNNIQEKIKIKKFDDQIKHIEQKISRLKEKEKKNELILNSLIDIYEKNRIDLFNKSDGKYGNFFLKNLTQEKE